MLKKDVETGYEKKKDEELKAKEEAAAKWQDNEYHKFEEAAPKKDKIAEIKVEEVFLINA